MNRCLSFGLALCLALPALVGAAESDALKAALEASRASGKGLNFYVNGQAIPGVVVSVDEQYVVARSQALGQIVIRLDRLDGVAGFVTPASGSKAQ